MAALIAAHFECAFASNLNFDVVAFFQLQRLDGSGRFDNVIALPQQDGPRQASQHGFIVDEQDPLSARLARFWIVGGAGFYRGIRW